MVTGIDKTLKIKNILSKITEYDIYRYYLGYDFQYKKLYPSPFRKEEKGSFCIMIDDYKKLHHYDFGNSMYKGSCFHFVEQLFCMDFNQALNKINSDFNLGLMSTLKVEKSNIPLADILKEHHAPENVRVSKSQIKVFTKEFTKDDLEYWKQYGITKEELIAEDVFSVKDLYINGHLIIPKTNEEKLRFAYLFKDPDDNTKSYIKVYTPLYKEYKWISNVPVTKALNVNLLPRKSKTIIIIKSKKDKLVIKKIHPDVYEVQKEGTECISKELNDFFDEHYDNKVCFFDNDETGKNVNKLLNSRGYGWVNIPNLYRDNGIKDPSDLIKFLGEEQGYEVLKDILKKKGIV